MDPLAHLAIIWAGVFVAVVMAKMTRLTPVLFFLFVGSFLVNVGILPAESGAFIRTFAELGIIFIMFALGFEESTDNFIASVKRSWGIALFGALAPFVVAYVIADYVWNDPNISSRYRPASPMPGAAFISAASAAGGSDSISFALASEAMIRLSPTRRFPNVWSPFA